MQKWCLIVTAALPWYGMFSGSFLLYFFVLLAAGSVGAVAFWLSLIAALPLGAMLLIASPLALYKVHNQQQRLSRLMLNLARTGTVLTSMFSVLYTALSLVMAYSIWINEYESAAIAIYFALNAVALFLGAAASAYTCIALFRLRPATP